MSSPSASTLEIEVGQGEGGADGQRRDSSGGGRDRDRHRGRDRGSDRGIGIVIATTLPDVIDITYWRSCRATPQTVLHVLGPAAALALSFARVQCILYLNL